MGRRHKNRHKKWPGPPQKKTHKELVYLHTRIEGRHTVMISPRFERLKRQTEGMPWAHRISRIAAISGRPFTEIREKIDAGI